MAVLKVIEILSNSPKSWEDATNRAIWINKVVVLG